MNSITVSRHKRTRFWAVRSADGELICVCVYKRGALEVARRLEAGISYCLRDAPTFGEMPPTAGEPRRWP
jgi:hypothetical protein